MDGNLKFDKEYVKKNFFCSVCKINHKVSLPTKLLEKQKNFPFTYIYFHGSNPDEDEDILTTLYLDASLNIRTAESLQMNELETNLSQTKSSEIIKNMKKELLEIRKDYKDLNGRFNDLREEHQDINFQFEIYKFINYKPIIQKIKEKSS